MYYLNNTTYNEKTLMGRLRRYFLIYFETFSVSTADSLFLLIFSILALESAHSIRFLYHHFLSGITKKSLNVFYYACSYAKVDYSNFMNITARTALKLIPDPLKTHPVFLCVDDTMVSKSGKKFENVSKLFNHAAHNGSNYLNGHCFVSIMLCVPVLDHDKISYLSVPLGYRMWQKKESKLELAASMIRQVMPEFLSKNMSLFSVTAGIQRKIWSLLLMNIQTLISLAMQGLILSCMISLLNGLGAEDVLLSMENGFALKQILLFPRKRSVIIIQVSAGFSQRSLATGKFLLMSRILKKGTAQNVYFSAQSFQKI